MSIIKNLINISLLILSIIVILSCKKETYNLNNEFTLDFNKTAVVSVEGEKWKIRFIELVEESRCPPDAMCFWAGQVAVKIEIDQEIQPIIGIHTTIPSSYQYKNHIIHLKEVTYTKDKKFGVEKRSSIRLEVN